jgi:hypothetical protein
LALLAFQQVLTELSPYSDVQWILFFRCDSIQNRIICRFLIAIRSRVMYTKNMTTAHSFTQWWVEHAGVHPAATDPMFTFAQRAWIAGEHGNTAILAGLQDRLAQAEYFLMCEAYDAGRKAAKRAVLACAG